MATKKEQRQQTAVEQVAIAYREKMQAVKALEKEIAPLKKLLTDHARALAANSIEIGGVTLEKRVTKSGIINPELVSLGWLRRMQKFGFSGVLKIGVNAKEVDLGNAALMACLDEVDYAEKDTVTYAVRI